MAAGNAVARSSGRALMRRRPLWHCLAAVLALTLAAACSPPPTPLPAALVPTFTQEPSPEATATRAFTIGVIGASLHYFMAIAPPGVTVAAYEAGRPVDALVWFGAPAAATGLGLQPPAQAAPDVVRAVLWLQAGRQPFNAPETAAVVRAALSQANIAQALSQFGAAASPAPPDAAPPASIRARLANLGYPDGLPMTISGGGPGLSALIAMAGSYGLELRPVSDPAQADLAWEAAYGAAPAGTGERLAEISLPIAYWVSSGAPVGFTLGGLPIPGE